MIKGIVLKDCHGNQIAISENWIKANGSRHNSMFWAVNCNVDYEEGDWVEVAFFPFFIGRFSFNEEIGEYEFLPVPEYDENGKVSIGRHFYHNNIFQSSWKSDRQKGLDIDIQDIEWTDIEYLKIIKLL